VQVQVQVQVRVQVRVQVQVQVRVRVRVRVRVQVQLRSLRPLLHRSPDNPTHHTLARLEVVHLGACDAG